MDNQTNQDTEFIKEKMKQRPLNKRKLLRRTLLTALMAVVFGTVACLTFLLLEPIISNRLYPKEEPEIIEFPVESTEEILPEDMIADEAEMQAENKEPIELEDAQIEKVLAAFQLDIDDYITMHNEIMNVAKDAQKAMVTVTGVSSDIDWFNNTYENEESTSGVIVFDNSRELLILVNMRAIADAEMVRVTFCDGSKHPAEIRQQDSATGFAILAIPRNTIKLVTMESIKVMSMGSSTNSNLQGSPIIAVGRLVTNTESVIYGMVTSTSRQIYPVDGKYRILNTSMYGSTNASGILINMRGHMIGMIDNSYNGSDAANIISAMGITELTKLINKMTSDDGIPYLGLYTMDVTQEINEELNVPLGAYVTEIEIDSPAMEAGIQSGDVIIKLGTNEIINSVDYVDALMTLMPEQSVQVTFMRQNPEGYSEITVTAVLKERE